MKPLPVVANGLYPLNSSFNTNWIFLSNK
jgi:hypothetical protein